MHSTKSKEKKSSTIVKAISEFKLNFEKQLNELVVYYNEANKKDRDLKNHVAILSGLYIKIRQKAAKVKQAKALESTVSDEEIKGLIAEKNKFLEQANVLKKTIKQIKGAKVKDKKQMSEDENKKERDYLYQEVRGIGLILSRFKNNIAFEDKLNSICWRLDGLQESFSNDEYINQKIETLRTLVENMRHKKMEKAKPAHVKKVIIKKPTFFMRSPQYTKDEMQRVLKDYQQHLSKAVDLYGIHETIGKRENTARSTMLAKYNARIEVLLFFLRLKTIDGNLWHEQILKINWEILIYSEKDKRKLESISSQVKNDRYLNNLVKQYVKNYDKMMAVKSTKSASATAPTQGTQLTEMKSKSGGKTNAVAVSTTDGLYFFKTGGANKKQKSAAPADNEKYVASATLSQPSPRGNKG